MSSIGKGRLEGYLLIDHTAGDPGPAMNDGKNNGLRRGKYESATITCVHCQRLVVLRPDRSRERSWCARCDKYECDFCAPTTKLFGCPGPLMGRLDELATKLIRGAA